MQQTMFSQPSQKQSRRIQHNNQSGWFITDNEMIQVSDILSSVEECADSLHLTKLRLQVQNEINEAKSNKIEKQNYTIGSYASENDSLKTEVFILLQNYKRLEGKFKKVKRFGIFGL